MQPYIEKEIDLLSKNLSKLQHQKEDYLAINSLGCQNKGKVLDSLKEMYQQQMEQLR